ncbi:unnamed protein product [Thelazia callipaeda]|uniref:peptidylprolyl isomerase n=1 Tax=Thelazia callipaeda TaxID=103827 RepID=A0A0N5CY60_THECL|nr:unnamed protein product [Thelazia callipaeda]
MPTSAVVPPEFDEKLNHLFFAQTAITREVDAEAKDYESCNNFLDIYETFVENRQNLINELRNIADKSVNVKKKCSISTITGSSLGIAGGATAIVGTVVSPPLLAGGIYQCLGLLVAGLATASNLGVQLTQYLMFREMITKVVSLSKYDIELMQDIESMYQETLNVSLVRLFFKTYDAVGEALRTVDSKNLPSLGLQLGAGGAKSATALGLRSVGIEMVQVGSKLMRGVARGVLGLSVVIDGMTILLSVRDIVAGSVHTAYCVPERSHKFSNSLKEQGSSVLCFNYMQSMLTLHIYLLGTVSGFSVGNHMWLWVRGVWGNMFKRKSDQSLTHAGDDNKRTSYSTKKKVLPYEDAYLRSVPRATLYEKSFMHRETITYVIATPTNFIITASTDGHLKFWKKKHGEGIEFVKHFRCHLHAFSHLTVNHNGTLMATVCMFDRSLKIFDVPNFDMINMLNTNFSPTTAAWIHQGNDVIQALAVSDLDSGKIYIYDGKGDSKPLRILDKIHSHPVKLIEYNSHFDCAISVDVTGMLEFWSGPKCNYSFPENIKWLYKTDTDLYEFIKIKAPPHCLVISPNGKIFATVATDRRIRIFDFSTGRIISIIDGTLQSYLNQAALNNNYGLQNMEWSRRVALEKDLDQDDSTFQHLSLCFDESSNFIIYPTPVGIRVYNLHTDQVVREIGKNENMRFLSVSLCRAIPDSREQFQGAAATIDAVAATNPNFKKTEPDPMLVACAYRKNRFYLFTNSEPFSTDENEDFSNMDMGRDVYNEKPKKEDVITAVENDTADSKINESAVLHTSFGDIHIKLFSNECPKAVENFCTHVRRGYYNGLTFHRVIRSFMIQESLFINLAIHKIYYLYVLRDPTGKGTGGQSIWGEDFEDEFHPKLRHDKPFMVSMANAGPNTNGSQFFITVIPADWLDGKNTLFGQVTEGFNVVQKINQVPTFEKSGRPKQEISIVSITLK